jgi:hypothetical protein
MPNPIPEFDPVMTAVFPVNEISKLMAKFLAVRLVLHCAHHVVLRAQIKPKNRGNMKNARQKTASVDSGMAADKKNACTRQALSY